MTLAEVVSPFEAARPPEHVFSVVIMRGNC